MGSPTCPTCAFYVNACTDPWHDTPPAPATCGMVRGIWTHDGGCVPWGRKCSHAPATPPAHDEASDDQRARIEEAHRALGKPGRVDDDGCCVGCGRSVQPSPCCPDYPVWPGPCRSCYAYDEEQRARDAVVEAAHRDALACPSVRTITALRDAALRGTNRPEQGVVDDQGGE